MQSSLNFILKKNVYHTFQHKKSIEHINTCLKEKKALDFNRFKKYFASSMVLMIDSNSEHVRHA